jgi:hypothetical protein
MIYKITECTVTHSSVPIYFMHELINTPCCCLTYTFLISILTSYNWLHDQTLLGSVLKLMVEYKTGRHCTDCALTVLFTLVFVVLICLDLTVFFLSVETDYDKYTHIPWFNPNNTTEHYIMYSRILIRN